MAAGRALIPLHTVERAPTSYDLGASETVEGGMIGYLGNEAGEGGYAESPTDYKVVVKKANGGTVSAASVYANVLGVIDDSSTGVDYGTLLGSSLIGVDSSATISNSTMIASGKCSLWMLPGIFATNNYGQIDEATYMAAGTVLYVTNGYLDDTGSGAKVAAFIEFMTAKNLGMEVSPANQTEVLLVFKFDPMFSRSVS